MSKRTIGYLLLALLLVAVGARAFYQRHRIEEGREAYQRLGCPVCHGSGRAPSLAHVGRKYRRRLFVEWLTSPQTVYQRLGRRPLNQSFSPMPRQAATPGDIEVLSYYLASKR